MKKGIFAFIIFLALFLRVWNLDTVPPSPTWDEVSYGYNAYSILKIGMDEYGVRLPVILKSYGDYKPALYSYLAMPSISVFDLNPFAVRLPNALISVLGVVAVYFLTKKMFRREDVALISSFLLAVSPWFLQFSRFSHEAVVSVTLNILTVLFFLVGLKRPRYLLLAAFFSALSLYSYQSEKLFAPLLVLLLLIVFIKDLIKIPKRYLFASIITGLLIAAPMLSYIVKDPQALSRATGTSIFSHQTEILEESANKLIEDRKNNNVVGLIIHNRRVIYSGEIVKNYVKHFDPYWLLIEGDQPRHHPPGMGVLYAWELFFALAGVASLLFGKILNIPKKAKLLLLGWLLLAPLPAAFTFDVPHAGRSMNILPTFQILAGVGVVSFFLVLKSRFKKEVVGIAIAIVGLAFVYNFSYYLWQYYTKLNVTYSQEWQYGYKEAVLEIDKIEANYEKIIVSNKVPLDQSYMFFLFYLKYSPSEYQKVNKTEIKSFGKYEFREINLATDLKLKNTLIVGSSKEIIGNEEVLNIKFLDGKTAIKAIDTR